MSEAEFWDMTLGEAERAYVAKEEAMRLECKQRALMDYKLAELTGRWFSAVMSKGVSIPDLLDHYAFLFKEEIEEKAVEERKQAARVSRSVAAFLNFADLHNKQFITDATTKEVANE